MFSDLNEYIKLSFGQVEEFDDEFSRSIHFVAIEFIKSPQAHRIAGQVVFCPRIVLTAGKNRS